MMETIILNSARESNSEHIDKDSKPEEGRAPSRFRL